MPVHSTLFVGLGSSHGDDRVGWMVADALELRAIPQTTVRRAAAPLDILDWLEGVDCLALCDACQGIGAVGTWRRWPAPLVDIPVGRARHSHDLGLPAALQLGARLGPLPRSVVLWSVEIRQTEPDKPVSTQVAVAVPAVVDDIVRHLLDLSIWG